MFNDNSGGAIIVKQKWVGSNIHAQRLSSNGTLMWDINGVTICDATGKQTFLEIFSGDDGSTFFTWEDDRNGISHDIFAQKIDINGIVQWKPNGTEICTTNDHQLFPQICTDGAGGAIITWSDLRESMQLYGQRINSSGDIQWGFNGTLLANYSNPEPGAICSDGEGGAIILFRSVNSLYALRINANGTRLYGILLFTPEDNLMGYYTICSDGEGGAFIAWEDRNLSNLEHDILAQRVDSNGNMDWSKTGKAICNAPGDQWPLEICSNVLGSAFISWEEGYEVEDSNIYIFLLEKNGKGEMIISFSNFYLIMTFLAILALIIVSRRYVH